MRLWVFGVLCTLCHGLLVNVFSDFNVVEGYFEEGFHTELSWDNVTRDLEELNTSPESEYKLLFLARHGEGWHNVAPYNYLRSDWVCHWQLENGDGPIEWYDAELTPTGHKQTAALARWWADQVRLGAPLPQKYYVLPMRRTLETFYRTWSPVIDLRKHHPVVKELARETYGIGTSSKRHNASYILDKYPFVELEVGFSEDDELWIPDKHESYEHRDHRAWLLLNDIFEQPGAVVSVTSHLGLLSSLLKVVGNKRRGLHTGELLPVIVEAKRGTYREPHLTQPWKQLHCEQHEAPNQQVLTEEWLDSAFYPDPEVTPEEPLESVGISVK